MTWKCWRCRAGRSPTPAGERFLERARAILASLDAAGAEANRIASGEVGRLAIGFTGTATYELLPTLARVLREDLPGIELDLNAVISGSRRNTRTSRAFRPLAGTTGEVELAVAWRKGDTSPVARVLSRAQALLGGGRPAGR